MIWGEVVAIENLIGGGYLHPSGGFALLFLSAFYFFVISEFFVSGERNSEATKPRGMRQLISADSSSDGLKSTEKFGISRKFAVFFDKLSA